MTRNTYKLASNCSLQSSKLPIVAGDIILKNRVGMYFPLKAKSPIIITDAAQSPTGYTISASGLGSCTDIFFDGQIAYTIRQGALVKVDLSTPVTRLTTIVNYTYQADCGAIAKITNSIGVYCYKTASSNVLIQAFDLGNFGAVGPSRNITVSPSFNAIDLIACKFGGNDAVAILWQSTAAAGTFNISIYLVTAAGIAAASSATINSVIVGGDTNYAKLLKSADGTKLIALSGNQAGTVNAATGVAIVANINIGFSVLQTGGCTFLQSATGLYLYQVSGYSTAIVIKTLGFDGSLTTANSVATIQTGANLGKIAPPVLFNNNYFVVVPGLGVNGSVIDVFDQNMVFISRSVIALTLMTGLLDILYAVLGDNGLLYVYTFTTDYTDSRSYREVIDLNFPKPSLAVVAQSVGGISPAQARPCDPQRATFIGGVIHFFSGQTARLESPQVAHSPQGVALTAAAPGSTFVLAEIGDVNSPVQQVIDGVGTYNGLTGVTPAGKRVTILNGGKVRLENV